MFFLAACDPVVNRSQLIMIVFVTHGALDYVAKFHEKPRFVPALEHAPGFEEREEPDGGHVKNRVRRPRVHTARFGDRLGDAYTDII